MGPLASIHAFIPPATWATGESPISCATLAANADRRPLAQ